MNEILILLLVFIAGALPVSLWYGEKVTMWRIRWIKLEHDSAQKEGREPRDIDAAFPKRSKEKGQ